MAQSGATYAAFKTFGGTTGSFSFNEKAKPFAVTEVAGAVLCFQFAEGFCHTIKLQRFELIQGWVIEHVFFLFNAIVNESTVRHGCWDG